jgi:hypothetical protein
MRDEHIAESDWKKIRDLKPAALNRFCERVLLDIQEISSHPGQTPHEKYLAIYELMQERDRTIGEVFNDLRRSVALMRIIYLRRLSLLTDAEFTTFSEEARALVQGSLRLS